MKILGVLLLTLLVNVSAFPEGPPESTCVDMKPGTQVGALGLEGHTTLPQNQQPTYGNTKEAPYYFQIFPEHAEWTPGMTYSVSIVANQTLGENHFLGLLLQARTVDCAYNTVIRVKEEPLGEFSTSSDSTLTLLKLMTCGENTKGSVSHKSRQWKINETVSWKAPESKDSESGDIVFRATIVREATVYWTEVHSVILRHTELVPPPRCSAHSATSHLLLVVAMVMILLNFN